MSEVRGEPYSRLVGLDVLRIVAILGVIAIHNWSLLHVLRPGTPEFWLDAVLFGVGRWSVPVFVMISGGLLLASGRPESAMAFYRRRLARVGIPALVWIPAYLIFRTTFLGQDLTRRGIVSDLVNATPFTHLYFVYVIVGLYLATPFIRRLVGPGQRRALVVAAAALLATWALDAFMATVVGPGSRVTGLTYWVPFLGYYLAGAALFRLDISRRAAATLVAMAISAITLQVVAVGLLAGTAGGAWTIWPSSYWSPFTIVASTCLYVVAARRQTPSATPGARLLGVLADASFGVFLVHEMILYLHASTLVGLSAAQLVTARVPTYLVGVIVSFVVVIIARRVRYLRHLV